MNFLTQNEYNKRYSDESDIWSNAFTQKILSCELLKPDLCCELRKTDKNNAWGYKWKEKSIDSITDNYSSGNLDTLLDMNKKDKEQKEVEFSMNYETEIFDSFLHDNNQSIDSVCQLLGSIISKETETNLDMSEISKKIKKIDNKKKELAYFKKKKFKIERKSMSGTNYSQVEIFQACNDLG